MASIPSPLPALHQEVRFVSPNGGPSRAAYVTSFLDQANGLVHLFMFADANFDATSDILQYSVPYSKVLTDMNTWHYISDEP